MPLQRRVRVIAAKVETTVGTSISTSGSDAVFNAYNVEFQPGTPFIERMGQSALSPLPGSIGATVGTVTFEIDLIPGSGAVPAWASTFLPACGWVNSGGTFSPQTNPPGSGGVKTLTFACFMQGTYHQIRGAMGNAVFTFTSGEPARAAFTFTGIYDAPGDTTIITPTYPTLQPLRFVSSALALGSYTPVVGQVTIDLGNTVAMRPNSRDASGLASAIITGRRVTGSMDPEGDTVANLPFYADYVTRTERALSFSMSENNLGLTVSIPKMQITGVQEGERDGIYVENLTFQANRSASAGDDELTFAFDTTP